MRADREAGLRLVGEGARWMGWLRGQGDVGLAGGEDWGRSSELADSRGRRRLVGDVTGGE